MYLLFIRQNQKRNEMEMLFDRSGVRIIGRVSLLIDVIKDKFYVVFINQSILQLFWHVKLKPYNFHTSNEI